MGRGPLEPPTSSRADRATAGSRRLGPDPLSLLDAEVVNQLDRKRRLCDITSNDFLHPLQGEPVGVCCPGSTAG